MIYLTLDQLLTLHEIVVGPGPVERRLADPRALGYCVLRPQDRLEGIEMFATPAAKAAALLQAIVATQPFVDGNRRTAWAACRTFLLLNGHGLLAEPEEVSKLLARVRRGEAGHPELRDWIDARLEAADRLVRNRSCLWVGEGADADGSDDGGVESSFGAGSPRAARRGPHLPADGTRGAFGADRAHLRPEAGAAGLRRPFLDRSLAGLEVPTPPDPAKILAVIASEPAAQRGS